MELAQQEGAPVGTKLLIGVIHQALNCRVGTPQFSLAQDRFAAAVPLLRIDLRGEGTAVQLKVELTDPHRNLVGIFQRPIKELLGSFHHDFRRAA